MTDVGNSVDRVFRELERRRVRWCLWRGSPRIDRAFAGESDFDLLVDPVQHDELAAAMASCDYRRARAARPEPGLEDWFGLGGPVGPLLHVHVHYRLVAGAPRCNEVHLPWAEQVLDARRPGHGAKPAVAAPVHEAALLLVRCSLQLRWRDRLPGSRSGARLLAKVRGDLGALLPDGRIADGIATLHEWLGGAPELPATAAAIELAALARLRRRCRSALAMGARSGSCGTALLAWWREAQAGLRALARRCGLPLLPWRGCLRGGAVVAIVDADATRRRELAGRLHRLLRGKFDVLRCASPPASPSRWARARARGLLVIVDASSVPANHPAAAAPDLAFVVPPTAGAAEAFAALLQAVWQLF